MFLLTLVAARFGKEFKGRLAPNQLSQLPYNLDGLLDPMLIPRVSGTDGNAKVRNYLVQELTKLNYHIELDEFEAQTPFGLKRFANVIATRDLLAERRLVYSAHYDSKYFEDFEFIGATDSAAPCAILLGVARSISKLLDQQILSNDHFATVQFIFFDGEEAFVEWNDNDSIYGARNLAKKWDSRQVQLKSSVTTPIKQIDLFVLLDLLGTKDAVIPNTHPESSWAYSRLYDIQHRLVKSNLGSANLKKRVQLNRGFFQMSHFGIGPEDIADDHVPFYKLGVPVLHCIPVPFPSVWHTKHDNGDAIDKDTLMDLLKIFSVFAVEYLGLDDYLEIERLEL
jgi:glutaminyl-peptide cyclotransferase